MRIGIVGKTNGLGMTKVGALAAIPDREIASIIGIAATVAEATGATVDSA